MTPRKLTTGTGTRIDSEGFAEAPEGFEGLSLHAVPLGITITDPGRHDNPLIFVNRAFAAMTGYGPRDTLGRNCRFLQGDLQNQQAARDLSDALSRQEEITVDLVNFRADGSRFLNRLMVAPLYWEDGALAYFLGVQCELPATQVARRRDGDLIARMRDLQGRVRDHLTLVLPMIRRASQTAGQGPGSLEDFALRLDALSLVYEQVDAGVCEGGNVRLDAYMGRVCAGLERIMPSPGIALMFVADPAELPAPAAGELGLLVSECAAQSLRHAFEGRRTGRVEVTLEMRRSALVLTVEDDGSTHDRHYTEKRDFSARLIHALCQSLRAEMTVTSREGGGSSVSIRVPVAAPD